MAYFSGMRFSLRLLSFVMFIVAVAAAAIAYAYKNNSALIGPIWISTCFELFAMGILLHSCIRVIFERGKQQAYFIGQLVVMVGFFSSEFLGLRNVTSISLPQHGYAATTRMEVLTNTAWILMSIVAGVYAASCCERN